MIRFGEEQQGFLEALWIGFQAVRCTPNVRASPQTFDIIDGRCSSACSFQSIFTSFKRHIEEQGLRYQLPS